MSLCVFLTYRNLISSRRRGLPVHCHVSDKHCAETETLFVTVRQHNPSLTPTNTDLIPSLKRIMQERKMGSFDIVPLDDFNSRISVGINMQIQTIVRSSNMKNINKQMEQIYSTEHVYYMS